METLILIHVKQRIEWIRKWMSGANVVYEPYYCKEEINTTRSLADHYERRIKYHSPTDRRSHEWIQTKPRHEW